MINNEYIRRHRTIHVVNACGEPVQVKIDNQPPVSIAGTGQLVVSEGRHQLQLSGAVSESHRVDVQSTFLDRWFRKPLWLLNPGGEAVLEQGTLYYAENPPPSHETLIVGRPIVTLGHVDYAFESPPAKLDLKRKSGIVEKISLQRFQGSDANAFLAVIDQDRLAAALNFAEARLRRQREQQDLFKYYVAAAWQKDTARLEAFLKSARALRPFQVQCHRAYQTVAELGRRDDELVGLYESFLKAEPKSAELIYLRGRVDPNWDEQDRFFRRAIQADPKQPWPLMAAAGCGRPQPEDGQTAFVSCRKPRSSKSTRIWYSINCKAHCSPRVPPRRW